jgi:Protein of unknown function (DUF1501)
VIRSMHTDIPNHEPSMLMMNTGFSQVGRPSMGAWLTYGLGTDNQNLPGYVVLCPDVPTTVGPPLWNSAFLPAVHQGTYIPSKVERPDQIIGKTFDPQKLVSFIHSKDFTLAEQRRELDLMEALDTMQRGSAPADPQLEAAIGSMETAYRMQTEAPDVFDIRKESKATLELYGPGSTARGCLMAVRLVERGVRMVQVYYAKGDPWDAHADIQQHRKNAKDSDQPFAAVIKDLKSRGLFKDTLVVCGSEFGRTPVVEVGGNTGGVQAGRDHNPFGFSMWLAGGGVKGGLTYGATDDFGFKAIEKPVHVNDLHATILHLMGIDHTKLTYRYSGRDFHRRGRHRAARHHRVGTHGRGGPDAFARGATRLAPHLRRLLALSGRRQAARDHRRGALRDSVAEPAPPGPCGQAVPGHRHLSGGTSWHRPRLPGAARCRAVASRRGRVRLAVRGG